MSSPRNGSLRIGEFGERGAMFLVREEEEEGGVAWLADGGEVEGWLGG